MKTIYSTTLVEGQVRFTSEKEHEEVTLRPGYAECFELEIGQNRIERGGGRAIHGLAAGTFCFSFHYFRGFDVSVETVV